MAAVEETAESKLPAESGTAIDALSAGLIPVLSAGIAAVLSGSWHMAGPGSHNRADQSRTNQDSEKVRDISGAAEPDPAGSLPIRRITLFPRRL
jgi:hypothetical protein